MGSPGAKGAASRARMLDAAIELMRGSGLTGAGINEIVKASGAPKGSVYHFFPEGKQQIAASALQAYALRVREAIDQALAAARSPQGKVRALFAHVARRLEDGGFVRSCAVGAVSLDLDEAGGGDAVQQAVADALALWTEAIAAHFDFGDRRRERSFAALLLTAVEGGYIVGRARRSAEPFEEAGRWLAALAAQQTAAVEGGAVRARRDAAPGVRRGSRGRRAPCRGRPSTTRSRSRG